MGSLEWFDVGNSLFSLLDMNILFFYFCEFYLLDSVFFEVFDFAVLFSGCFAVFSLFLALLNFGWK